MASKVNKNYVEDLPIQKTLSRVQENSLHSSIPANFMLHKKTNNCSILFTQ